MFGVFSTISRYFYSASHGMGYHGNWNNKLRNAAEINNILSDVCVQCGQQRRIFVIVQSPEHCPHQNMKIFQYSILIYKNILPYCRERRKQTSVVSPLASILLSDLSSLNSRQHPGLAGVNKGICWQSETPPDVLEKRQVWLDSN